MSQNWREVIVKFSLMACVSNATTSFTQSLSPNDDATSACDPKRSYTGGLAARVNFTHSGRHLTAQFGSERPPTAHHGGLAHRSCSFAARG